MRSKSDGLSIAVRTACGAIAVAWLLWISHAVVGLQIDIALIKNKLFGFTPESIPEEQLTDTQSGYHLLLEREKYATPTSHHSGRSDNL